jgi:hypothetical protein
MSCLTLIAILVGIVFPLEYWLDVRWYISLSLSVIGYLLMRYTGLGINERRRLKREMERRDVVDRKTDPV